MLSKSQVVELLNSYNATPSLALGQNFLVDSNALEKIVNLAKVGVGDYVVEIGTGLASLTMALARRGARVVSLEKDRTLFQVARGIISEAQLLVEGAQPFDPGKVVLKSQDAMKYDWTELNSLLHPDPMRVTVSDPDEAYCSWTCVSNLPYNIATPLIIGILERVPEVARLVVLVQNEVAQRLCALTSPVISQKNRLNLSKSIGAVSLKVAYYGNAKAVYNLPPDVFYPKPNVQSTLIEISRHKVPPVALQRATSRQLFELVEHGFATRRKMLSNSLAGLVGTAEFQAAKIDPARRPEELSLEDWVRLANSIY